MKTDNDLRLLLGGIQIDAMKGDNLAIELAGVFSVVDEPDVDDMGWGESALNGCKATLDAIHAHYLPTITRLRNERDGERMEREKCSQCLRDKDAAMGVLFDRLHKAGVDISDLIP